MKVATMNEEGEDGTYRTYDNTRRRSFMWPLYILALFFVGLGLLSVENDNIVQAVIGIASAVLVLTVAVVTRSILPPKTVRLGETEIRLTYRLRRREVRFPYEAVEWIHLPEASWGNPGRSDPRGLAAVQPKNIFHFEVSTEIALAIASKYKVRTGREVRLLRGTQ